MIDIPVPMAGQRSRGGGADTDSLQLWGCDTGMSLPLSFLPSFLPGFHCRGLRYCLILRQVSRPFLTVSVTEVSV